MCSNFQAITPQQAPWVKSQFGCDLPETDWREEIFPTYAAPFIFFAAGQIRCEIAQFGLVPHWATDKQKFGLKTYNARTETVAEKPSYRNAWRRRQYGLAIMQSFYEPCYETGKAVRWRIKRSDGLPLAVAAIWENIVDKTTGSQLFSFSMLTINATHHPVMQHFHKPDDEKRSVVVLQEAQYANWLKVNPDQAKQLLKLSSGDYLAGEAAPIQRKK